MASIEGSQTNQTSTTTSSALGSFLEPITGQTIQRNGEQPVSQWVGTLPQNDVGLSTLDRWQADFSPQATAQQIRAELAAQIVQPTNNAFGLSTSPLEGYRIEVDNVKIGYAMGQIAAGIEARIAANPGVSSANASALAAELRNQGSVLSHGAARDATAIPGDFSFRGNCYPNADAMARAAIVENHNPTGTVVYELTPQMERQQAQAAMDRAVLGTPNPLGYSWGETAYMYARGTGASLEGQQRAMALGGGVDALFGVAGSFAGAGLARNGNALPGGQAGPLTANRTNPVFRTEPAPVIRAPQTVTAPVRTAPVNPAGAPRVGADLVVNKPSILSDRSLSATERTYVQQQFARKEASIQRAAERGELVFSPGTKDVRIESLQSNYRDAVATRFERVHGRTVDLDKLNADHPVDLIIGGSPTQQLRMLNESINKSVGSSLRQAAKRADLQPGDPIRSVTFK